MDKSKYFIITTTPQVAEQIKKQVAFDDKLGIERSYILGDIRTEKGMASDYSIVQIKAKEETINPSDIFFLGLFCGLQ